MTKTRHLRLSSIDDYLGPGETRFFSRGYQRAIYHVHGVTATGPDAPKPGAQAKVDLSYPADWSKKKANTDLRPHLSTIDALILGVQIAEVHLAHANRLDQDARRTVRLRKVTLRAGTAPQEDLIGVPLTTTLAKSEILPSGAGRSVYDSTVGALRVRCDMEHPINGRATEGTDYATLAEALGPRETRFYGEGFKQRRHTIENIWANVDALTARAEVRFTDQSDPGSEGIEGARQPSVSMVDCFVVNLQLAQVLMYELDSLRRQDSNTLWMMQTVMEAPEAPEPVDAVLETNAAITASRLLPLRGGTWRSVDIQAELAGIAMRCSFAHELPAEKAAAA
jgi:Pseudomonas avirulence D protein (AvrD)